MCLLVLFAYVPLLNRLRTSGTTESNANQALTALDPVQVKAPTPTTSPSSPAEETETLKVLQRGFESHLGYSFNIIMAAQKKKHTENQLAGLASFRELKKCPACELSTCKVKESRPVFEGTRRRYACFSCNHKFTTYEVSDTIYEELRRLRSKMEKMQHIFMDVPLKTKKEHPVEKKIEIPEGIPCYDCIHLTPYGCSFDIPEAQTEAAEDCNLFKPIISDSMLT